MIVKKSECLRIPMHSIVFLMLYGYNCFLVQQTLKLHLLRLNNSVKKHGESEYKIRSMKLSCFRLFRIIFCLSKRPVLTRNSRRYYLSGTSRLSCCQLLSVVVSCCGALNKTQTTRALKCIKMCSLFKMGRSLPLFSLFSCFQL